MDGSWELLHGDCRSYMGAMQERVAAIVTSPPYADQRNYSNGSRGRRTERASSARPKDQSRRSRSDAPLRFADEFVDEFLPPMFEVLADDGALMLNLGVVMRDGEESPYADVILAGARAVGFKLLQRIIWHKPNGGTPSNPDYLRVNHEYVFWLAKSKQAYRGYDRVTRTPHRPESISRARRGRSPRRPHDETRKADNLHPEGARPSTVFECAVGGEPGIKHPAKMPLKVARHLVALSAPEGALVLDPFAGSGTTGVACVQLGRRFVGVELEEKYLPECKERLGRARLAPGVSVEQLSLDV